MENVLEIKSVSKKYAAFQLNDISFKLPKGYIMGLIGINGAGKSTLLKIMMDIVKKDGGDVTIFGKNTKTDMVNIKQDIGFVFDDSHFYDHLTCQQMKQIIAPFYKNWDEGIYQEYINRFNLPVNKPIKTFSKGMKMQFNICIALSHHAKLILMDEPTAGLDPIVRRELLKLLQEVVMGEEVSVLFSTHVTTDLEKIADYITFIHQGKVLFCKEKDAILEEYFLVKGDDSLLDEENQKAFIGLEKSRVGFQGLSNNREEILFQFGDEVLLEQATLEDIMYFTNQSNKK